MLNCFGVINIQHAQAFSRIIMRYKEKCAKIINGNNYKCVLFSAKSHPFRWNRTTMDYFKVTNWILIYETIASDYFVSPIIRAFSPADCSHFGWMPSLMLHPDAESYLKTNSTLVVRVKVWRLHHSTRLQLINTDYSLAFVQLTNFAPSSLLLAAEQFFFYKTDAWVSPNQWH